MVTKKQVIEILKEYKDPEINIDLWTLGLIYNIKIKKNLVKITMTLTTPFCPYGPQMIEELKHKFKLKGLKAEIEITFDPPWQPSDELKEAFGI